MDVLSGMTIRRWLILQGVGTATLALLLTFAGFLALESMEARRAALEETSLLAEIVGSHVGAALAFDDDVVARETLASLGANPRVRIACLYDAGGVLFAFGPDREGGAPVRCPTRRREGATFRDGRVLVSHSVRAGDEEIGRLYLESDMESLGTRIGRKVQVGAPILGGAVLAALLFATWIQRRVAHPIHSLVESTRALARGSLPEGDAPSTRDTGVSEVAVLARAFAEMGSDLRDLVVRTRDSTAAVAETVATLREASARISADGRAQRDAVAESTQSVGAIGRSIEAVSASADDLAEISEETSKSLATIDASITDVSGRANELALAVDSTAQAVTELIASTESTTRGLVPLRESARATVESVVSLSRSVESVRESADESDQLATATAREALRGCQVVDGTILEMREIREGFEQVENVVEALSEKSEAIGGLVNIVSDVAEETGLLALNAAIIAAQAGEQGKGFSVVAQQVRTLADRTSKSLKEITELVLDMQKATATTVSLVESGSSRVQHGVTRSEEAGVVLREIGTSANQSATIASRIAKATEAQTAGLEQVRCDATRAQEIAEQIASSTEQQRRTSAGIGKTTEHVGELVEEFERLCKIQREGSRQVDSAGHRIAEIAAAARAQRDQRQQLDEALRTFRDASEQSARHAEEIEGLIEGLAERSGTLELAMSRFQL